MRLVYSKQGGAKPGTHPIQGEQVAIGRHAQSDLVLKNPFVPDHAAMLVRAGKNWEVIARSDIVVGGHAMRAGERALMTAGDKIEIFPYTLHIETPDFGLISDQESREQLERDGSQFILKVHHDLVETMDSSLAVESRSNDATYVRKLEEDLAEIARLCGLFNPDQSILLSHFAASGILGEMISGVVEMAQQASEMFGDSRQWTRMNTAVPDMESEIQSLTSRLSNQLGLTKVDDVSRKIEMIEAGFWQQWRKLEEEIYPEAMQYFGRRYLTKQIKDIIFGYGPLEDLLRMPHITEIMVVDREKIYIEKAGLLEKSGRRFVSDDVTESIIERIVSRVGRRIDRSQPLVDARLKDGSRVNAVIPPLAVDGPCLTIRKFPLRRMRVDDLIARKSITAAAAAFLQGAVLARCNILVSGGTGSGKTTMLNCLSNFIPDKERIVTIEDTVELQIPKGHVVRMETKPPNVEGAGEYTIRALVRNALRMRPDRIIVGECRGDETIDMLQAMNTGHDGSMTTIHANSSADVILRLETLVQSALNLPIESIHRQIAAAIDLIVQLSRLRDGSRRVTQITEVIDYDSRADVIRTKDLFLLDESLSEPILAPTGSLPTFLGELIERGQLDLQTFYL